MITTPVPPDTIEILKDLGDILFVRKPIGFLTIPGRGDSNRPVLSHILGAQLRGNSKRDRTDLYVVHRLDEYTSGVMVFARTATAHKELSELFESHNVQKTYWALTQKPPSRLVVDAPLFKIPSKKNKSVVSVEKGKPSLTRLKVINQSQGLCLIEASPQTGRSHQIRVHLSHVGAPIVGDKLYGGTERISDYEQNISYPILHAKSLKVVLPSSMGGETVEVDCAPDGLFKELINRFFNPESKC